MSNPVAGARTTATNASAAAVGAEEETADSHLNAEEFLNIRSGRKLVSDFLLYTSKGAFESEVEMIPLGRGETGGGAERSLVSLTLGSNRCMEGCRLKKDHIHILASMLPWIDNHFPHKRL